MTVFFFRCCFCSWVTVWWVACIYVCVCFVFALKHTPHQGSFSLMTFLKTGINVHWKVVLRFIFVFVSMQRSNLFFFSVKSNLPGKRQRLFGRVTEKKRKRDYFDEGFLKPDTSTTAVNACKKKKVISFLLCMWRASFLCTNNVLKCRLSVLLWR